MAIVQISKIIHRTGANVDLPQLDIGEIGFASDEQKVYIGNDPAIVPPVSSDATTQTEILTSSSTLDFSRIQGSDNSSLNFTTPADGQLIGVNVASGLTTVVNVGGSAGGLVNLGTVGNVKLNGGTNGYILQTDGAGNLAWTTNGVLTVSIANVTKANPAVVSTLTDHLYGTGVLVTVGNVLGMTQLTTAGVSSTNSFYVKRVSNTTFSLHTNSTMSANVDSSAFTAATASTGYALGTISPTGNAVPGGSTTQVQYNNSGAAFGGDSRFTYSAATGNLTLTGNINTTTVYGNLTGNVTGIIGGTTNNLATFTSVTVNNNLVATGNVTAGNVIGDKIYASHNAAGENFRVGDDAWIGDINVTNTMRIKGVQDATKGYVVFGNNDTTSTLGRSGSGPLTYTGNLSVTGSVTPANVHLSTWTIFANINGVYANDGTNTYSINMTQL